jgi:hypothetical protein
MSNEDTAGSRTPLGRVLLPEEDSQRKREETIYAS